MNKCSIISLEQMFFKEDFKMPEILTPEERKKIIDDIINDIFELRNKQDINPACDSASISKTK